MPINPCKECGSPVSDKADSCPACGAKQKKKTSVFAWFFLIIIALAIIGMCSEKSLENKVTESPAEIPPLGSGTKELTASNWMYETSKDEMRDITSQFATTISTNKVYFDFPYNGGSNLALTLRQKGADNDVMLSISKGQFVCGFNNCEAFFKFDDGSIEPITLSRADSHASDLLFVTYDKTENRIINQLKNSTKLVIEVPFYKVGKQQFIFNVSGLKWD